MLPAAGIAAALPAGLDHPAFAPQRAQKRWLTCQPRMALAVAASSASRGSSAGHDAPQIGKDRVAGQAGMMLLAGVDEVAHRGLVQPLGPPAGDVVREDEPPVLSPQQNRRQRRRRQYRVIHRQPHQPVARRRRQQRLAPPQQDRLGPPRRDLRRASAASSPRSSAARSRPDPPKVTVSACLMPSPPAAWPATFRARRQAARAVHSIIERLIGRGN